MRWLRLSRRPRPIRWPRLSRRPRLEAAPAEADAFADLGLSDDEGTGEPAAEAEVLDADEVVPEAEAEARPPRGKTLVKWLARMEWVVVPAAAVGIWMGATLITSNAIWSAAYLVLLLLIPYSLWKLRKFWTTPEITAVYTVMLAIGTAALLNGGVLVGAGVGPIRLGYQGPEGEGAGQLSSIRAAQDDGGGLSGRHPGDGQCRAGGRRHGCAVDHGDRAAGVGMLVVERGRDEPLEEGKDAGGHFHGGPRCPQVSEVALDGRDGDAGRRVANRLGLDPILANGAQTMGIDVAEVWPRTAARSIARPIARRRLSPFGPPLLRAGSQVADQPSSRARFLPRAPPHGGDSPG